jgi:cytochrome c
MNRCRIAIVGLFVLPVAGGCGREEFPALLNTDPELGRQKIVSYGCGNCHRIPGIRGARGEAGPPLTTFARQSFIAGAVANTPINLATWIKDPQSIDPGTAMPMLGVSQDDARHIAAYLYSLR